MRLIGYELKKIFYYQKGWLCILLFLALKLSGLILFNEPENIEIQNEISSYSYYMDKVQGKITEETQQYMAEEADSLSEATSLLQNLNGKYYDGKIDRLEYESQLKPLKEKLDREKGFDIIYKQFEYAREKPENRYMLNTNGWNGLLSQEKLDWLLYILLFLLLTPVFCEENRSNMDIMILTQRNGGKRTADLKLFLSVSLAVLLSLFNSCTDYVFFFHKYGLRNGTFPLQSLSYFMNSGKEISLYEAFLAISCIKVLGAVFLATITLFLSVYTKRYSLILLINTSMIFLPFYTFSLQSIKYYLPSPLGILTAIGFFRGNEYKTNPYTGQLELIFQEISCFRLVFIILIAASICTVMSYMVLRKNTNTWYKIKISSHIRNKEAGI